MHRIQNLIHCFETAVRGLAPLALMFVLAPASSQAEPPAEIQRALQALRESGETFIQLIEPLTEEQWNFQSPNFRRTIGEEAEHISLSEHDLIGVVVKAMNTDADPAKARALAGKEDEVRDFMLNPEDRAEAFKVQHRLKSKPEVQEFFPRAHRRALRVLEGTAELGVHIYKHPSPKYGELTALQWFYYITYHKLRHCEQIKMIMAEPDFPSAKPTGD